MLKHSLLTVTAISFLFGSISSFSYDSNYDELDYSPVSYSDESQQPMTYSYNDGYYDNNISYQPQPKKNRTKKVTRTKTRSSKKKASYGLPSQISTGEKVIIIDPNIHRWGAYSSDGQLLRSGLATAGSHYCRDLGRPCRTKAGTFRIKSLGSRSCKSSKYPLGRGGAPMPYCMFFNGSQGLHGSYEVVAGNVSHGCVRMHVDDAAWVRFNFAKIGTKVIVRPY